MTLLHSDNAGIKFPPLSASVLLVCPWAQAGTGVACATARVRGRGGGWGGGAAGVVCGAGSAAAWGVGAVGVVGEGSLGRGPSCATLEILNLGPQVLTFFNQKLKISRSMHF